MPSPPSQNAIAATNTAVEPRNRDGDADAAAKKKKKKQRVASARDPLDATATRSGRHADGIDEDRTTSSQPVGASKADSWAWADIVFATSGLDKGQREGVERLTRLTKARMSASVLDATHLIVGVDATRRVKRTAKYLSAIVSGATIVGFDWVDALLAFAQ